MTDVGGLIEGMITAVGLERDAVEQRQVRRDQTHRADAVHRLDDIPGCSRYRVRMGQWPPAWTGSSILVRTGSPAIWRSARVDSVTSSTATGSEAVIELETPLPPGIGSLQMRRDDAASLRLIISRLQELRSRPFSADLRLAVALVAPGTGTSVGHDDSAAAQVLASGGVRWNADQRRAVSQALGSELTFIWGPPGTGKSDVLAAVIEGCYRQGRRVFFVAPTHVALDQALLRLCERLRHEPDFARGLIRRLNAPHLPELTDRFGAFIDPVAVESRLSDRLIAQADRLRAERERVTRLLATAQDPAARSVPAAQDITGHARDSTAVGRARDALRSATGLVAAWWRRAGAPLAGERRSGRPPGRTRAAAAPGDRRRRDRPMSPTTRAPTPVTPAAGGSTGAPDQDVLRQAAARLDADLDRTQAQRARLRDELRARARIVAGTTAAAVAGRSPRQGYDTVVMDEAGMISLPTAFLVAALGTHRVVIAGDFRQLPAVVQGVGSTLSDADRDTHVRWYSTDPFTASGTVTAGGRPAGDDRLVALGEQYRMRPGICALVNALAYPDAPLRTGRPDTSRLVPTPVLPAPLVLIDTSGAVVHRRGNANVLHSEVILELVRRLHRDGVLHDAGEPGRLVPAAVLGVITPYRDQARLLGGEMVDRFGAQFTGLVDTVHRFQGSQRPVIVLDTVAGGTSTLDRFYRGHGMASDTGRLLNVAASRAQDHLVVVADVDAFTRLAPTGSQVRVMVDHLRRHAQTVPLTELIPLRSASEVTRLRGADAERPALIAAADVIPVLEWDIGHARRRIDLHCPSLHPLAATAWTIRLQDAAARGVKVTVSIGPGAAGEPAGDGWANRLRAGGVHVEQGGERGDVPPGPVLTVDDVEWHGSFHVLAHARPPGVMLRSAGAGPAGRLGGHGGPPGPGAGNDPGLTTGTSPADPADRSRPAPPSRRIYLAVPFAEKDEAKRRGARWDPRSKRWYIDAARTDTDRVARWLPTAAQGGTGGHR